MAPQSRYLMQVVDRQTGDVHQWEPGRGAEADLIETCVDKIMRRSANWRASRITGKLPLDTIESDIRTGIEEAMMHVKSQVRPVSIK